METVGCEMTKTIDLELAELDVLLCITGIALDDSSSELVSEIVECLISDMKELPSEFSNLEECKKGATVQVTEALTHILKKLGGF